MNYNQNVTYFQARKLIELGIEVKEGFIKISDALSFIESKHLHIVLTPYNDVFDEYDYIIISYYYQIYEIDSKKGTSVIAESEYGKSIGMAQSDTMHAAIDKAIEILYGK